MQKSANKHEENSRPTLRKYWVGVGLDTRPILEQAAAEVYDQVRTTDDDGNSITPKDTLPGLKAADIDKLKNDLATYKNVQTEQGKVQQDASSARQSFEDQCQQISRRRRKIQIDSEYPVSLENAAFRKRVGGAVIAGRALAWP